MGLGRICVYTVCFVLSLEMSDYMFGCYAATASSGFSLIVIDPPWENGSAQQKSKYAIAYSFPYHFKSPSVFQMILDSLCI